MTSFGPIYWEIRSQNGRFGSTFGEVVRAPSVGGFSFGQIEGAVRTGGGWGE